MQAPLALRLDPHVLEENHVTFRAKGFFLFSRACELNGRATSSWFLKPPVDRAVLAYT